jgi:hypothetical protein
MAIMFICQKGYAAFIERRQYLLDNKSKHRTVDCTETLTFVSRSSAVFVPHAENHQK